MRIEKKKNRTDPQKGNAIIIILTNVAKCVK